MNVQLLKTKPTKEDFIQNLVFAYYDLFNKIPSENVVCLIYAKFALETGYGNSCYNYNLGNIKQFNKSEPYVMLSNVWEIIDGKKVIFQPPHQQTWFRAYDNWRQGMRDYLSLISSNRYIKAWNMLQSGDPIKYVTELKNAGYFTGSLQDYINSVSSIFKQAKGQNNYKTSVDALQTIINNIEAYGFYNQKPYEVISVEDLIKSLYIVK